MDRQDTPTSSGTASREERLNAIANSMCLTWRHDYGLGDWGRDDWGIQLGMPEAERQALFRDMRQLAEHHIAPLLDELDDLHSGKTVVLPHTKEHADAFLLVAEACSKTFNP